MPRSGGGIYVKPFPDVTSGTTIASAVHNGIVADVETDLNAARPVIAGGTGAVNALGARTNLQAERAMATVTNYDSHVWENGSFWSAAGATAGPPSGGTTTGVFSGIAYSANNDPNFITVEAREVNSGLKYIRQKSSGIWGAWVLDAGDKLSNTGGTITGNLNITGTLGVTGTTTLGTLNAGATSVAGLTAATLNVGAITSTTINTQGNTITAGAINASGTVTAGNLTTSGTASSGAVNTGTITSGAINASGWVTAPAIKATNSDGLRVEVPGGSAARIYHHVAGVRVWTTGVVSTGTYAIADESAPAVRLTIGTDGNADFQGNNVYAGAFHAANFHGYLNGNISGNANYATTAGSAGSITGGSSSPLEIGEYLDLHASGHGAEDFDGRLIVGSDHSLHIQSGSTFIYLDGVAWVSGTVNARGYKERRGISGAFREAHFNICLAESGAAFEFWSQDTNYGAIYMASDYRTKKDVKPLPSMWDRVKALNPVSYTTAAYLGVKADNDERWGLIAHELQDTLVPTAANGRKDAENVVQSPNPMAVIAALTKALQEAMERIEVLESIAQPT